MRSDFFSEKTLASSSFFFFPTSKTSSVFAEKKTRDKTRKKLFHEIKLFDTLSTSKLQPLAILKCSFFQKNQPIFYKKKQNLPLWEIWLFQLHSTADSIHFGEEKFRFKNVNTLPMLAWMQSQTSSEKKTIWEDDFTFIFFGMITVQNDNKSNVYIFVLKTESVFFIQFFFEKTLQ